jgi:glycosyltransferase involved in cell wall biosynthesis
MNVGFCLWLWSQSLSGNEVWILFHEVAFPIQRHQPLGHNVLGVVTRGMAWLAARAATRIFVTIPGWEAFLSKICRHHVPVDWLPVPSNLSTGAAPEAVAEVRERLAGQPGEVLLGHFSTYGPAVTKLLAPALPALLELEPRRKTLLLGHGGEQFGRALIRKHPGLSGRIQAPGFLSAKQVAVHLAACDCLVQPSVDGVSTRRTSLMAGLALGLPIVSWEGRLTEPVWRETGAVALATTPDSLLAAVEEVLADSDYRAALGIRAGEVYAKHFALENTIRALRGKEAMILAREACS